MSMKLHFGMAQWQHPAWVGWLYSPNTANSRRLQEYAQLFDTVEVGSSFYSDLTDQQIFNWYDQVPDHFRFSFKLPQTITHQLTSQNVMLACQRLEVFCRQLEPFTDKLGVTMMQFPAQIAVDCLPIIQQLSQSWSLATPLSVEVRHLSFFDKQEGETAFLRFLSESQHNRVIMDSRPVFSTEAYNENLIDVQKKKPKVPCHPIATGNHPVVRYIGHPDLPLNDIYLDQWAKKLVEWLDEGLEPYVFVHSSDNVAAPLLAQSLEARVAKLCSAYQPRLKIPELQMQESLF